MTYRLVIQDPDLVKLQLLQRIADNMHMPNNGISQLVEEDIPIPEKPNATS